MTLNSVSSTRKMTGYRTVDPVTSSFDARDRRGRTAQTASETDSRQLPVPVDTAATMPPPPRSLASLRPQAPLVAQLIATHMGLPQTRTLRRASAGQADTAYRSSETLKIHRHAPRSTTA